MYSLNITDFQELLALFSSDTLYFSFIGVTKSLPATSSIKMIEVWLIVMMLYPLNVVFICVLKTSLMSRNVHISIVKMISLLLNWGLPLFLIFFTLIYWMVGLLQHTMDKNTTNYC